MWAVTAPDVDEPPVELDADALPTALADDVLAAPAATLDVDLLSAAT
jgi:hypothetical protein